MFELIHPFCTWKNRYWKLPSLSFLKEARCSLRTPVTRATELTQWIRCPLELGATFACSHHVTKNVLDEFADHFHAVKVTASEISSFKKFKSVFISPHRMNL